MKRSQKIATLAATASVAGVLALSGHAAPKAGGSAAGHDHGGVICHSRYGGPCYPGGPALAVTASLVQAGGGPARYSTAKALTAMVGSALVNKEVAKLTKQYGKAKIATWLKVGDFAVKDALRLATKAGVKLPKGNLKGKQLASALVTAGLDKDNTFYIEFLLDKAVTHNIHETVMDNIDKKFGPTADADYHRISNQAMHDLAHALGAKQVKLASFH